MSKYAKGVLFSAALLMAGTYAGTVAAQSANDDNSEVPGRYTVVDTDVGPVMVDTAFGRTWLLVENEGVHVWRRVFLEAQSDVPAGMVRRPPKLKN